MPRLVPNRKRAPEPDDSSDWPAPLPPHPYPHTRIRCIASFNYYRGDELLGRFVKGELQNSNDPLVIKAWADYPHLFEAELVS